MADQKVSELTAATEATANDLLYIVDEATTSKKITFPNLEGSISHTNIADIGTTTHAQIDTLSGSFYASEGVQNSLSGSFWTLNSTTFPNLSGAHYTHAADASDPHGAILTQTGVISSGSISGATIVVTDDKAVSGAYYVPNVVYTEGSSPTASNYPIGTLLLIYTP